MIKQVVRRENKIKWPLHSVQQPISYGNLGCIHMVFRIVVIASKKKKNRPSPGSMFGFRFCSDLAHIAPYCILLQCDN